MGNVVKLDAVRREKRQSKAEGVTLCRSGHHKWQVEVEQRFDVKQGRLVTTERCARCGELRTKLV
jgi:hypothetical protein